MLKTVAEAIVHKMQGRSHIDCDFSPSIHRPNINNNWLRFALELRFNGPVNLQTILNFDHA